MVRYLQGQEYAPHYDYLDMPEGTHQRLMTLLVYLEPATAGGGTSFPRAFQDRGLRVRPKRGSALLFYSQRPDGNLDELALHGGQPVSSGVKWVCNLWVHSHAGAMRGYVRSRDPSEL